MNYITITTEKKETYSSISNFFIDYYMTSANGEFVKIYLYLVRLMSSKEPVSVADIADHFNLTEKDICRAIKYWISQDVMRLEYNNKKQLTGITLLPLKDKSHETEDNLDSLSLLGLDYHSSSSQSGITSSGSHTERSAEESGSKDTSYTSGHAAPPKKVSLSPEMARKKSEDKVVNDLIFETEAYFGRPLSASDIESLVYIYDQLGLSQELIEYLIEYSIMRNKPFFSYMESVARAWYEKGITTVEEAKKDSKAYNPLYRSIFRELGITREKATSIESAYIDAWTGEMGFSDEIILTACRKAILARPQAANFSYVNGILENWHKKGVKSIRDIELIEQEHLKKKAEQTERRQAAASSNPNGFANFEQTDMSDQLDKLEKMLADELNLGKKTS